MDVTYSFGGVTFRRIVSGEYPRWWAEETIRQVDPILESSSRFVDVGGTTYEPLELRAVFDSAANLATLQGVRSAGTSGTLDKSTGESCTALLARITPIRISHDLITADLIFERIS